MLHAGAMVAYQTHRRSRMTHRLWDFVFGVFHFFARSIRPVQSVWVRDTAQVNLADHPGKFAINAIHESAGRGYAVMGGDQGHRPVRTFSGK
jgi:hypothetical protein